jgi:hypothetical protein
MISKSNKMADIQKTSGQANAEYMYKIGRSLSVLLTKLTEGKDVSFQLTVNVRALRDFAIAETDQATIELTPDRLITWSEFLSMINNMTDLISKLAEDPSNSKSALELSYEIYNFVYTNLARVSAKNGIDVGSILYELCE